MRRATAIVNLVNLAIIMLGLYAVATSASSQYSSANSEEREFTSLAVIISLMIIRGLANVAGVYGAYTFNIYLVGVSLAAYALECIFALITFSLIGVAVAAGFAYPHVFFIKEVRAGIMTKERYVPGIEEQSCCCV